MLTFGRRIFPFFFVSLLFLLSIFFFTGWMPTSPAGSYDGNWSLIVGCLPCVVGYHLQLVVFLIGSHLWLGHIGRKKRFQKTTPENERMSPKKGTISKRDHIFQPLVFHGIFVRFGGERPCPETKSWNEQLLHMEAFELGMEGGRLQGLFLEGKVSPAPKLQGWNEKIWNW